MIYLKSFDTEDNYLAYRNDKDKYLKPNVSLSDDNGNVYYNYSPSPTINSNGHDYVDLGLPSGTLWATMNVGALKPSDYGQYFQWGDMVGYAAEQIGTGDGKKKFANDWSDYKWGKKSNFTKYTIPGATLDLEDDAAHVNMGGDWHMPSKKQCQELLDNTISAWTTSDSVSGVTFTSKKDASKSIFIPAAGIVQDSSFDRRGSGGIIWTTIMGSVNVSYGLFFDSDHTGISKNVRRNGLSVRGVIGSLEETINGYTYVDFGLPSRTKWATCNVGASKPTEYGKYFQWADTQGYTKEEIEAGKKKFASDWSDYKLNPSHDGKTFTMYTNLGDKLDLKDDAAHANMGGDWHMPTPEQIEELFENTTTAWTTSDGVSGLMFTSEEYDSIAIFIPAAGYAIEGTVEDTGKTGGVWSSMLNRTKNESEEDEGADGDGIDGAESIYIDSEYGGGSSYDPRYSGLSVRGVIG